MTAIAAIVENNIVYIGGDSAGVAGLSIELRRDAKVFTNGEFIFGFTTSFRMGSLLRYSFSPPKHPNNMGVDRYLNTIFVEAIRKCFKNGGYGEKDRGGTFILGYRGRLFYIESDFQVGIPRSNYTAVGCGSDLCKGSLHTTEALKLPPRERIQLALKAAAEFSAGVSAPFVIKRLGADSE